MTVQTITSVEVGLLRARETNPRFDLGDLDSLTSSVKSVGVIQPLTVTPDGEGYVIVAGHRRHAAAITAGLKQVPCLIVNASTAYAASVAVHENTQRQGLSAAEKARGIQGMLDAGISVREVAKGIGATQQQVKTLAAASKATDEAVRLLHAGTLTLELSIELSDLAQSHPDIYDATIAQLAKSANASWVMNEARQAVVVAIARAEADAIAKTTGVKVLSEHPGYESTVTRLSEGHDHAGQDCYALFPTYATDWDDDRTRVLTPKVVEYCLNTRAHNASGGAGVSADASIEAEERKAERRRVIANNKAWADANEIRAAWIAEHLQARARIPKKYIGDLLALNLARPYTSEHVCDAVRTVAGVKHGAWPGVKAYEKATTSEGARIRTCVLATVNVFEGGMDKTIWRLHREAFAQYLTLIRDLGYTLTPPEVAYVQAITNNTDPAEVDYSN